MKEGCINLMNKNKKWVRDLGTWFGLGDMPKAPGTFGTLGGVPVFMLLSYIRKFTALIAKKVINCGAVIGLCVSKSVQF